MSAYVTHLCPACAAGFPEECSQPQILHAELPELQEPWIVPCRVLFASTEGVAAPKEKGLAGRPLLDPSEITDVKSTGRKRAAAIMPFLQGQVCGWAQLKHAGGGVIPILGCQGNTIADVKTTAEARERGADEVGHRHHGPDKNVLNNTPGMNLHGVCTVCHNRWHALNDPHYDPKGRPDKADTPFLPVEEYYLHDNQTTFTDQEWLEAEDWWDLDVADRGPYPFKPPSTARTALPLSAVADTLTDGGNPFPESSPFTEIGDSA